MGKSQGWASLVLAAGCSVGLVTNAPAAGVDLKTSRTLPFEFAVKSVDYLLQDGQSSTIVNAQIKNGPTVLNSVRLHCSARNVGGHSWDVDGEATNFDPSETRSIRIVGKGGDPAYFANASKVYCMVAGFELGIIVDP